jgi:hypothetical protein
MILVTPFLPGRESIYKALAAAIKKSGQLIGHSHLVISEPADEDEARAFADSISDHFSRTNQILLIPADRGPIQRANDMLNIAMKFHENFKEGEGEVPNQPMLYLDPRWRPAKTGWMDNLQGEYFLRDAPKVTASFTVVPEDKTKVFTGPILFSPDYVKDSGLIDYLQPDEHWLSSLRWEMGISAVPTDLIGDTPKSVIRPPQQPKS